MDDGTDAAGADVTVVARRALDRWAVVDLLDVPPGRGLDLDTAFARLAHPTASATDVVLLVHGQAELDWLRRTGRALRGRTRGRVVAVLDRDGGVDDRGARRAGADVVLARGEDAALAAAVDDALDRLGATVLVVTDTEAAPA